MKLTVCHSEHQTNSSRTGSIAALNDDKICKSQSQRDITLHDTLRYIRLKAREILQLLQPPTKEYG